MRLLMILLTDGLPEGFPEQVEMPGYFLQALSSPAGIWCVRVMTAVVFIMVIVGCKYYEVNSSKGDRRQENKEE